jgi:hypothetical protein
MKRWLAAALALLVAESAAACALCLAGFQLSITAQELVHAQRAVLALPTADGAGFRVVEVIKGQAPAEGAIGAKDVFRAPAVTGSKPLLLVHEDRWVQWVNFGAIGAVHAGWLRQLASTKPSAGMNDAEWAGHVAFMLSYLQHPEAMVAEIAYSEVATAPYGAMRTLKGRLDAPAIRRWIDDPRLAPRRPLYTLLLGIAGDPQDAVRLEARLEVAWKTHDATNLAPMVAADLELRGPSRVAWLEKRYLLDPGRTMAEIQSALLALGEHGRTEGAVPRERVIRAYRTFIRARKPIAGLVAQDLAEWGCWDVAPEYTALLKSGIPLDLASRRAIVAYLERSSRANAKTTPNRCREK